MWEIIVLKFYSVLTVYRSVQDVSIQLSLNDITDCIHPEWASRYLRKGMPSNDPSHLDIHMFIYTYNINDVRVCQKTTKIHVLKWYFNDFFPQGGHNQLIIKLIKQAIFHLPTMIVTPHPHPHPHPTPPHPHPHTDNRKKTKNFTTQKSLISCQYPAPVVTVCDFPLLPTWQLFSGLIATEQMDEIWSW